jgi:DNA helicase-2/ATP-dependent DNA helicase PcrA
MVTDSVFKGLNGAQRDAVETVRGPVCILAGAGSGKTTTITRRIANQVATGAFAPTEILAVTFTDKAAGEMRDRLATLGAGRVVARTFHAAALSQLHYFRRADIGTILPSKAAVLAQIQRSLPGAYRFRAVRELATEIEWAKNRRLTPETYVDSLDGHPPPLPSDLMAGVFRDYETRKERMGAIDFEDVLELAVRLYEEDSVAADEFRQRYRAFTVDEYQDVNLLQQSLLERWLGRRDELCVVGDDYQSIYSFTGATPEYLLTMPRRYPHATIVRLEENYRSTPEILRLANQLVPKLSGARKVLRAVRSSGQEPTITEFRDAAQEVRSIVSRIQALHREGVRYEGIAVLNRINASSEEYEEAFSDGNIPFQVRGGAFLTRPAARHTMRMLRRDPRAGALEAVQRAVEAQGFTAQLPEGAGDEEATRQADLRRLLRLAEEFDDGTKSVREFIADLEGRFGAETEGRGVNLLTYHRAKGLEFEAVFLPRLQDGELPFKRSAGAAELAEERRLFYVGLTRAKTHLHLSYIVSRPASRFLSELTTEPSAKSHYTQPRRDEHPPNDAVLNALLAWRERRAKTAGLPPYIVFHEHTLQEIARRCPSTLAELREITIISAAKLQRYGDEVLKTVAAARTERDATGPDMSDEEVLAALKRWRLERSRDDRVPAFVVFHDRTLARIAEARPASRPELARLRGVGPTKLERYGDAVLGVLRRFS